MPKIPDIKPYVNEGNLYYKYRNWLGEMFYDGTCAYCLGYAGALSGEIDHYWPRKHFPGEFLNPDNLLISCSNCNRCKSDFFDERNPKMIFNCRKEDLSKLVIIDEATGELSPRKPIQKKDKERVLFNVKKFKLNFPPKKRARKELVDFLRGLEIYNQGNHIIDFLSNRYLFFHVFDIKIKKRIKKKILEQRVKNISDYKEAASLPFARVK